VAPGLRRVRSTRRPSCTLSHAVCLQTLPTSTPKTASGLLLHSSYKYSVRSRPLTPSSDAARRHSAIPPANANSLLMLAGSVAIRVMGTSRPLLKLVCLQSSLSQKRVFSSWLRALELDFGRPFSALLSLPSCLHDMQSRGRGGVSDPLSAGLDTGAVPCKKCRQSPQSWPVSIRTENSYAHLRHRVGRRLCAAPESMRGGRRVGHPTWSDRLRRNPSGAQRNCCRLLGSGLSAFFHGAHGP